jgi:hypothetical protein
LLEFTASPGEQGGAQLAWQTEPTVPDIRCYNLYWSTAGSPNFEKINNDLIIETEYYDETMRSGVITYRLSAVNGLDQEYTVGEILFTGIDKPLLIYPSMVKNKATIVFWFPQAFPEEQKIDVTVTVYDILGQKVKTIVDQKLTPGFHTCQFDGTDDNGIKLSAGTYFIILRTPEFSKQIKFIKL